MEYKVIKLAHDGEDGDETTSIKITKTLNTCAKQGWRLVSTEFIPWITITGENPQEYVGRGDLVLFLERKIVEN
jgi:hypothetical protein